MPVPRTCRSSSTNTKPGLSGSPGSSGGWYMPNSRLAFCNASSEAILDHSLRHAGSSTFMPNGWSLSAIMERSSELMT